MTPLHRILAVVALAAGVSLVPAADQPKPAPAEAKADDGFVPMFNGKNLDGWVNVNCTPGTFFVKGDEIITTGKPTGFLRTEKQYENFVLEMDWMHVNKTEVGNSGLFVWGDPLPGVGTPYTRGIEVQVLVNLEYKNKDGKVTATSHGDLFSIHGARCVPDRPHPNGSERCLPSEYRAKGGGEWNHYKVTAKDGVIKLEVNGKEVSGVSKCNPRKGYLALESEGAECHFKNIRIKELPSSNPKPEETATVWAGHVSLFNGVDLKGWKTEGDSWKVSGGKLVAAGKSDLVCEKKYGEVELILDWRLPAKGAARWYLTFADARFSLAPNERGMDYPDALWAEVEKEKAKQPDVKVGAWARTVVRFDGKRLTVTTNGVTAATLEAKKPIKDAEFVIGGAPPVAAPGLEIMNVFVRELKEKK